MGLKKSEKPLLPVALSLFSDRLDFIIEEYEVEAMAVERVSISMNMDTVRKIAYFESVALLASCRHGLDSIHVSPQTARHDGIGFGTQKKPEVLAYVRDRYGALLPEDECEAIVLALAYEVV